VILDDPQQDPRVRSPHRPEDVHRGSSAGHADSLHIRRIRIDAAHAPEDRRADQPLLFRPGVGPMRSEPEDHRDVSIGDARLVEFVQDGRQEPGRRTRAGDVRRDDDDPLAGAY
jgi:hypothetical protein